MFTLYNSIAENRSLKLHDSKLLAATYWNFTNSKKKIMLTGNLYYDITSLCNVLSHEEREAKSDVLKSDTLVFFLIKASIISFQDLYLLAVMLKRKVESKYCVEE